ncbi:MAG: M23 family metallopeptidase, partial [Alphaproteobacteria bacterium]|nr:M23 family metallopeptidase [Alphaproteobacteria bacterium]
MPKRERKKHLRKTEITLNQLTHTMMIRGLIEMIKSLKNNVRQKVNHDFAKSFILGIVMCCITLFFALSVNAQGTGKSSQCDHSCAQVDKNQAQGGCRIASSGNKLEGNSSTKLDTQCIKRNSSNGCFNSMPIEAGTGNYTMAGWRSNGKRNHYGTDIGASGYTNSKAFAAADGQIVHAAWNNGSGRTLAILHDKKCTGSDNKHYLTIYRHLWRVAKGNGENITFDANPSAAMGRTVKKDDVIGIVGGSNKLRNGKTCDHPSQDGGKSGCLNMCNGGTSHAGAFCIHLHFELWDGDAVNGTQASTSRVMQPSCQSASVLCGGCAGEKCGTRNGGPIPFGSASATQGAIQGEDSSGATSSCKYSDYLDSEKCIFCGLFKTMFNAASQIALMADNGLLDPTLNFVKIGFLIWLAIYLLKQLASFNATNSGEMAKGILFQGFRVAVVALILSSTTSLFYIMDLTLNPVMMTGMNFIDDLNSASTCEKSADYMQNIKGYSTEKGYSGTGNPQGGLSQELGESIVCSIKHLEDSTSLLMKLGNFSVCLGFHDHLWVKSLNVPHLGYVTTGIFLWLAGIVLLLTFPWCLVDCVLQLCIAAALAPCAIGAYAFKITSKYLKIVWDFFMNAMFNFVFMAIIIYIINQQLQNWLNINLGDGANGPDNNHTMFVRFKGLAWYGMGFIRVAAVCFFCYVFFDEAKSMAEKFASSPGLGGSKGIGRMVGGTVMDAAGKTGKAAIYTTGKAAGAVGAGLNYYVGNQYRSLKNHAVGALASKFGKNSSTDSDEDGNKISHKGSFRIFGRDIKFSATKGEDGRWSLTRETHKRSQSDKAFEKVLDKDGNEVRDENGNVKYRARHRIFGKVTGYEDMIATKDEDGNLVYSTADGKSTFRLDENGQIAAYKTRFTRSYLGLGKAVEKTKKQYGTNRIVNTATSRTIEKTDAMGNVTEAHTEMKDFNLFNRDLVRKDGTINLDTFNEMQKNMKNPEQAAKVLIAKTMEARGLKLDLSNPDTKVNIDENGRVTINQISKVKERIDGKDVEKIVETKNIQAVMIGDQMFIAAETIDSEGNTTLNESNGVFHAVQTATKQKDGTFQYDFDGGFSEHAINQNSFMTPLNHKGEWGNNINKDKAMAGFTQAHFDKYMDKLKLKQMERTMSTGAYNRSAEAGAMHSQIHRSG